MGFKEFFLASVTILVFLRHGCFLGILLSCGCGKLHVSFQLHSSLRWADALCLNDFVWIAWRVLCEGTLASLHGIVGSRRRCGAMCFVWFGLDVAWCSWSGCGLFRFTSCGFLCWILRCGCKVLISIGISRCVPAGLDVCLRFCLYACDVGLSRCMMSFRTGYRFSGCFDSCFVLLLHVQVLVRGARLLKCIACVLAFVLEGALGWKCLCCR